MHGRRLRATYDYEEMLKKEVSKAIPCGAIAQLGKTTSTEIFKVVTKKVVSRGVSDAGKAVVKGVAKEVVEDTVSKVGKEMVKTVTKKKLLTQSTSNSVALGVACGALFEGISTVYDISCAHAEMASGNISTEEYNTAVGKRVVTGVGSFGGSSIGLAIGQAAIPIPFVGGLVGSVVGGLVGSLVANITADAVL